MNLEYQELATGVMLIVLTGRLDVRGAEDIDLKIQALTTTKKGAYVVDLVNVEFIASIGIRTLLVSAKGAAARGGKLVLYRPTSLVAGMLKMAGITDIIPVYDDLAAACAAVALA